jgi:hypothetical protein
VKKVENNSPGVASLRHPEGEGVRLLLDHGFDWAYANCALLQGMPPDAAPPR